jgi:hypothetical protein
MDEVNEAIIEDPRGSNRAYPVVTLFNKGYDFNPCKWTFSNTTNSLSRDHCPSSSGYFLIMNHALPTC